ncbi:hypothetical protein [Alkalithermobacter paradoxus]|uniref:Uncharacterized protein n=1 Tax=Alkalithermobacter paradoxus TaxID=29349 RepID=A0A1V4I949_9FIRM|nr:hypothetical protein CLOTH_09230 [[Clostridium] thermoalcaliphilum]
MSCEVKTCEVKNCASKKTYTQGGTQACCDNANPGCFTPSSYDPNLIKAECIFVEKVYDSKTFHKEKTYAKDYRLENIVPAGKTIAEFIEVKINCISTKPITVEPITEYINSIAVGGCPTVPGPGGIDQLRLDFIDTSACDALGKGTPITVVQELHFHGKIKCRISIKVKYTDGSKDVLTDHIEIDANRIPKEFLTANLCIPSTAAAMKPSLAEFCAVSCDFDVIGGINGFSQECAPHRPRSEVNLQQEAEQIQYSQKIPQPQRTDITFNGILTLCITCEKKVKVPVQLCVLSTGFCDSGAIQPTACAEFPKLFPDQVNMGCC